MNKVLMGTQRKKMVILSGKKGGAKKVFITEITFELYF